MKMLLQAVLLAGMLGAASTTKADSVDPKDLEGAKPTSPAVQFADVKAWKPLGHRWAGAMNDKGELIAIYDLSYPDLLSRLPFTVIGGRQVKKKDIIQMIWDAKFDPNVDQKTADKAIEELEKADAGPIDDGAFPANWWKNVAWKNMRAQANEEPALFRLSDINLRAGMDSKKLKQFNDAVAAVEAALNDSEGNGIGDQFLERFEFQRVAPGTFEVQYLSPNRGVSKPRKIADIASTKVEFFNAMKLELAKELIDKALDLITIPIANAIVDTAISRFFHFHKLVLRGHQNMALEMINSLQDGTGTLSNVGINEKERLKAVEALSFAQSSFTDGWKWIWKKPVDEWNKDIKKQEDQAKAGMDWLAKNNQQVANLNKRFVFSLDPATQVKRLLLLAKDKPNSKKGPTTSIDYSKPNTPYQYRLFIEVLSTAVTFGVKFITIPYAGSVIKKAYSQFVEKPVDKMKIWESRLTVHLEGRSNENHAGTLATLDHQRVNPLFQSREKMNALILARKQMLGIQ